MEVVEKEEQEMAYEDVAADVAAAQDDQEPDVEAHDSVVEDVASDVASAQDDEEPDVEAHGWGGAVEDVVDAAADVVE
ncbi:MAG: hypothetical protein WD380_02905 [Gaiellaceae bacterium]